MASRCRNQRLSPSSGRGTRSCSFSSVIAWICLPALAPGSIDCIVTSPPYNLGVAYRTYDDRCRAREYLAVDRTRGSQPRGTALSPNGSLFLNVGGKPTDPWTAMDVAQAARPHLHLQNTIHWIKSIAIDREAAGAGAGLERDVAVGHYKPINSDRVRQRLPRVHLPLHADRPHAARPPRDRRALPGRSNVTRWRDRRADCRCRGNTWFLPYDTIQNRDKDRPHPATFPPRLPEHCLRLHGLIADPASCGSVPGAGEHRGRLRATGREFRRNRTGRGLPGGGRSSGRARPSRHGAARSRASQQALTGARRARTVTGSLPSSVPAEASANTTDAT